MEDIAPAAIESAVLEEPVRAPEPSKALVTRKRTPDEIIIDEKYKGGLSPFEAVMALTDTQCRWIYGHPINADSRIAYCDSPAVRRYLCKEHLDRSINRRPTRAYVPGVIDPKAKLKDGP